MVQRLLVGPGERVAVGTPLAVIGAGSVPPTEQPVPSERPPPVPPEPRPLPPEAGPLPPEPGPLPEPPTPGPSTPRPSLEAKPAPPVPSPLVRKLAAESGLDLATVHGTGATGPSPVPTSSAPDTRACPTAPAPRRPRVSPYARRLARDRGLDLAALTRDRPDRVLHARDLPAAPAEAGGPAAADPRAVTATLMARSKREIPHYYLATDLDLGPALDWLRRHNREIPVARRVLPAALLLRAVALAARDVPKLNGNWLDGRFVPGEGVHLGVAVSLRGGGLAAPVLRDADALGLDDLMARMREAAERARAGHLRSSEVAGATLTVTNLGDLGVDMVAGVIHPAAGGARRLRDASPAAMGRWRHARRPPGRHREPVRRPPRHRRRDRRTPAARPRPASAPARRAPVIAPRHPIEQELAVSDTRPEPVLLPGLAEDDARDLVLDVLGGIAPGSALDALGPHDDLRDTLGMDSLDFLALVTRVVERTGRRIEEDDYPALADLDGWVRLLTGPLPPADTAGST